MSDSGPFILAIVYLCGAIVLAWMFLMACAEFTLSKALPFLVLACIFGAFAWYWGVKLKPGRVR